jgi:ABC-2 type transport system permease protein|tara:strand:- start:1122 stop:1886 length:765 start_codon:yes stop_codon:yes gene_type:complete
MISNWVGFYTLSSREVMRFFSVWKQTIIPGVVTTLLYIFVFGVALENRISEISGVSYKIYILPGLLMMNVITNATANAASSMLQMKLLQTLPELLITPLSSLELSLSFIIGGAVRGFVNGVLILLICWLAGMPINNLFFTLLAIFLVSWSFASLGLLIGQLSDSWDQLALIQNFVITPFSFLGGIFYSIKMLPVWAMNISLVNPIFYAISTLRYTTLGVSDASFRSSFIFLVVFATFSTIAAVKTMQTGKKIRF